MKECFFVAFFFWFFFFFFLVMLVGFEVYNHSLDQA